MPYPVCEFYSDDCSTDIYDPQIERLVKNGAGTGSQIVWILTCLGRADQSFSIGRKLVLSSNCVAKARILVHYIS